MVKKMSILQHETLPMTPKVIPIESVKATAIAGKCILSGAVIALPTDTIYGIAVSAQNDNAIKKLYKIKKRDENKPIAICVGKISDIQLWGETSYLQPGLLKDLLPGPVTIVLKRKVHLNKNFNPDTDLVGIRIPNCPFIQKLANLCKVPLALTSANVSSEESALTITEFKHLWPQLSAVFDGGVLGASREGSTIVDLSKPGYYKIIRQGSALKSTLKVINMYNLKSS